VDCREAILVVMGCPFAGLAKACWPIGRNAHPTDQEQDAAVSP
jgi:hypothetical protein